MADKSLRREFADFLLSAAFGVAGITLFVSGGLLVLQIFAWLKDGAWLDYSLAAALTHVGLARPTTTWTGLQKVLDWALTMHISVVIFVVGLSIFWLLAAYARNLFTTAPHGS